MAGLLSCPNGPPGDRSWQLMNERACSSPMFFLITNLSQFGSVSYKDCNSQSIRFAMLRLMGW